MSLTNRSSKNSEASIVKKIKIGLRFFAGAVRLIPAAARSIRPEHFKIISVDLFGTLILRVYDEHYALRASALKTAELARHRGLLPPSDIVAFRREIERQIYNELSDHGLSTEFTNYVIVEAMLRKMGAGDWAVGAAYEIAEWELEQEIISSRPRRDLVNRIRGWNEQGIRILAVSDTRYTGKELSTLFARLGISGLSSTYSSVDFGATKFEGKLFDMILAAENAAPRDVLHFGDNPLSDILSAAQRGLSVRWIRRPAGEPALPPAPARPFANPAIELGYNVLGPVLVGFVRLVLDAAKRDGIKKLLFVARDGYLPYKVAEVLKSSSTETLPEMGYIYLSRRVVASGLADFRALPNDQEAVNEVVTSVSSLRGGESILDRFQNYYDIDDDLMRRQTEGLMLSKGDEADLRTLLINNEAVDGLYNANAERRNEVIDYLSQEGVFSETTALVDIGWRGTIFETIIRSEETKGKAIPRAYYFGFWDDDFDKVASERSLGLICDKRRGSGLTEGSAFHNVFLLEAVFKSSDGMVQGFQRTKEGSVRPMHLEAGAARQAELDSDNAKNDVQAGVFSYARWYISNVPIYIPEPGLVRKAAQRELFRLAFFPSRSERGVGRLFSHSEPTDDDLAIPLILERGKGLKGWYVGVRSPWKGGYFRATGGFPGAIGYCLAEKLLSYLSLEQKLILRSWLFGRKA